MLGLSQHSIGHGPWAGPPMAPCFPIETYWRVGDWIMSFLFPSYGDDPATWRLPCSDQRVTDGRSPNLDPGPALGKEGHKGQRKRKGKDRE